MQIGDVRRIVSELYPNQYIAISYKIAFHENGEKAVECGIYVSGGDWHFSNTFKGAIDSLKGIPITYEEPFIEA